MTGGPWNRSKVGVHGLPGPCFVLWIQSNYRIEFSTLRLPIAHLPAGRLTCANSGEIFVANPPSIGFMNGGRQNFPPIHTMQVAWASARRLIAHLIAYIKSINVLGSDVTVLTFQCLCSSFNIQFNHYPFDVFIRCSTVSYFKECFNAKGRTKKWWRWFFEIVSTWISKVIQDGSTMLHAIYHVIDVWHNSLRPEHSWL